MKPLVSIITPCYNGEEFLDKYFQSILKQTYRDLELIFVNDGSTDSTEEIVASYKDKIEERGIKFVYIVQENKGQAAAINQGLAIFEGEYFVWPDSDDLLSQDSIEKRALFLEENPEYGFVRSNADFFDYNTNETLYRASNLENRADSDIFLDLILEKTYCYCGCYMVRRTAFLDIYPERRIQISSAGQNWQLLIPLSARYKCGYIDEDLYHIAVREGSHSRAKRSYEQAINRQKELKGILMSSIDIAGRQDKDYRSIVERKYTQVFFRLSLDYCQNEMAKEYYKMLKSDGAVTTEIRGQYLRTFHPRLYRVYYFCVRVYGKIRRTIKG